MMTSAKTKNKNKRREKKKEALDFSQTLGERNGVQNT
jgi:hypothetical protein